MMRRALRLLWIGLLLILVSCAPDTLNSPLDALNPQLLLERVDTYRRLNRPVQALHIVELVAAHDGWTPDLALLAGDLRRSTGDLDGAVAAWKLIPTPGESTLRTLAQAQIELGQWWDAEDSLTKLIAMAPDDRWAQLNYGLLMASVNAQVAMPALQAASQDDAYRTLANVVNDVLERNVDQPLLPMRVGVVLADQDQWAYAEVAFERAAELNEPYAEALAYYGLARDRQGKDGGQSILRAVALEPGNARVRYLQGVHLRLAGDSTGAIDALAQAIAVDPQNPAYYAELAQAYRDSHELEQAERWFLTAVALSNGDARYQEMLALFYADEGGNLTASGLQALEQAMSALPESADARAGYGWALYAAGETERGTAIINEVLESDANNARALYYKAQIVLDAGDVDTALGLLEQVASGTSDFAAPARALLADLQR
ncbi:MAG: tetratricopeptide repeat protein [Anaerolineae bacterium]|nr:tetratricopeptide repeat protein [Anaerolineae bacterium]